ncbi:MAG: aldehyde dehydrogenase family protein [Myxococcales bacterium]|jgi:glutamate-5-semialdehyde dehydrogenase
MSAVSKLTSLSKSTQLLFGGDRLITVPDDVVERFEPGDSVVVVEATEQVLLIPATERGIAEQAVGRASEAFAALSAADDARISQFFEGFASRLADDAIWEQVAQANARDVEDARRRGRSTTRLSAGEKMRQDMIDGLRGWIDAPSRRGQVLETVQHDGWRAELVGAALGVVAFVFEGRPNVLADATGVLRGGNAVVFRIGRDALGTARTLMQQALTPALEEAGLPAGSVVLVESAAHAAGHALFCDHRLSLAVARGSGPAVATLGALAQQAGVPVSLHGTGGAWIVAGEDARPDALDAAVYGSLDRKVCNTLNTLCIPAARAEELVPVALAAMQRAGERLQQHYKLHVVEGDEGRVPAELFDRQVPVQRAEGEVQEPQAERLAQQDMGREWEWEQTPEVTLKVVGGTDEAVELFNRHSPQFVASLISDDPALHERFYARINAPFVGDGVTRWVDGQKALCKPELGLSNWQWGRLFGRGGILSGDSVFTVRTRARSD